MTLQEERMRRTQEWEQKNGRKLEDLTESEWIDAAQTIFCLTRSEAEDYLAYLQTKKLG